MVSVEHHQSVEESQWKSLKQIKAVSETILSKKKNKKRKRNTLDTLVVEEMPLGEKQVEVAMHDKLEDIPTTPLAVNETAFNSKLSVHRCRFIPYMMSSIVSMSYYHSNCNCTPSNSLLQKLAVARSNGDIQIYTQDIHSKAWFLQSTICTRSQIETIVFMHHRLFAGTLGGKVVEFDLDSLREIRVCPVEFGCVWSMTPLPSQGLLALGTESGEVRLVSTQQNTSVDDEEEESTPVLEWISSRFEKIKSRIMSITWASSGDFLVAGTGKGTIHVMDIKSGRSIRHMACDKVKGEDTIVWDLKMLKDNQTVVSGDSLGYVCFWHLRTGTLWKRVKAHAADVLTLAIDHRLEYPDEIDIVYSSGVDRKVSQICNVPTQTTTSNSAQSQNNATTWSVTSTKRYHSHDVRSLVHFNQTLASGGVDTGLIFSSSTNQFTKLRQERMPLYPHKSPVSLASETGLLLCHFNKSMQIWSLFGTEKRSDESKKRFLLQMNIKSQSNIIASAISKNGEWIACVDADTVRLFSVQFDSTTETIQVKKCKNVSCLDDIDGASSVTFSPDGSRLVIGASDGTVYVVLLSNTEDIQVIGKLSKHAENAKKNGKELAAAIVTLAVSADGQWLVSADTLNNTHVFQMDSLEYHGTLPRFQSPITSLTFHPYLSTPSTTLIITLSSNNIYLFDIENLRLTSWSQENSENLPSRFTDRREIIMGVAFDERRPGVVFLWGSTYVCTVDLEQDIGGRDALVSSVKRQKLADHPQSHPVNSSVCDKDKDKELVFSEAFKMDHRYQAIMFMQQMNHGQLVLVERPILHALAQLPNAFYKHTYGT